MRILLLGNIGQLGWELERTLATVGYVIGFNYPEIDLTQPDGLDALISRVDPQIIVNATAYTAVDQAEQEADTAYAINAIAPGIMAEAARKIGAALIHFSTDYVFDGAKGSPYVETDEPNPLGVYGSSKLAGERAIQAAGGAALILRTSWVYSLRRESFVTKVLEWSRRQAVLRIVDDQVGNPTWCRMLAEITAQLIAKTCSDPAGWIRERRGLYHLAGSGHASRLEWAREILALDPKQSEQVVQELLPAKTGDFPTPARRPLFSALNCDRFAETFGLRLPDWREALKLAMAGDGCI
jgi:dTDP-4-dehydrorhamnose reductase